MSNPNKVEIIRNNIQASSLLSDHEKADWLNLLELMNDKQLGELAEILAAEPQKPKAAVMNSAPAPTPVPASPQMPLSTPMQNIPPLSHIANVPTGVNMSRVSPGPLPPYQGQPRPQPRPAPSTPAKAPVPVAPPRPAAPPVPPKTNFAPLSVRPTPSPNLTAPIAPAPQQTAQVRPAAPAAPQPQHAPAQPQSHSESASQQSAPQPHQKTQGEYKIEEIEELQNLSLQSLRDFTPQSIATAVRSEITEHGYFAVLQLVEMSSLYSSYIAAGKERLGMKSASGAEIQAGLTQEEFEFMVDLLRSMRFNRW